MSELARALGRRSSPRPAATRVFLVDEVVAELRLRERGAIYRNAACREVQAILTDREKVDRSLREPFENVAVVTVPERTVGVEAFKPTAKCRRFLQRHLLALTRIAGP